MTSISITQDFPVPARPASKTAEFHAHVPKIFSIARLWAIARKEAIQLRRDARSLGLAFVLPVIMLILFGYAITTDVEHITTAIVDRDHTPESRALTSAFSESNYFMVKYAPQTDIGVEELIDLAKVRVVIVIPERFSVDLKSGRAAPVELLRRQRTWRAVMPMRSRGLIRRMRPLCRAAVQRRSSPKGACGTTRPSTAHR